MDLVLENLQWIDMSLDPNKQIYMRINELCLIEKGYQFIYKSYIFNIYEYTRFGFR